MAQRTVAAWFLGPLQMQQPALFEINQYGVGDTTEQAGGQAFEMGVMPDDEDRFTGTRQSQGHGAGIFLWPQTRGFQ
jgi:molybdopterin biosynthesis enzyme